MKTSLLTLFCALTLSFSTVAEEGEVKYTNNVNEFYLLKETYLKDMLSSVNFGDIDLETNYSIVYPSYETEETVKLPDGREVVCVLMLEESTHVIFHKNSVYEIQALRFLDLKKNLKKNEDCEEAKIPYAVVRRYKKPLKASLKKIILESELITRVSALKNPNASEHGRVSFQRKGDTLKITGGNILDYYTFDKNPLNISEFLVDLRNEATLSLLDIPTDLLNISFDRASDYNVNYVGLKTIDVVKNKEGVVKSQLSVPSTIKEFLDSIVQ